MYVCMYVKEDWKLMEEIFRPRGNMMDELRKFVVCKLKKTKNFSGEKKNIRIINIYILPQWMGDEKMEITYK